MSRIFAQLFRKTFETENLFAFRVRHSAVVASLTWCGYLEPFTARLLQCGFIPCGFYNVLQMWVLQAGYCNVDLFPVGPAAKSGQFKVVTSQTLPS